MDVCRRSYHLAYCNQDLVVRGLSLGAAYPEAERELLASPQALGVWNELKFSERQTGQSAAESVAQWRQSSTAIRDQMASMQDAVLERRCWFPIFTGWEASLGYGASDAADLVLTQSAESSERTFRGIEKPAEAIEYGSLQVSNFENLATFGQLFPM